MDKKIGFSIILIFVQIFCGTAQNKKRIDIASVLSNKVIDSYPYSNFYKQYNTRQQLDSVFELIAPKIKSPAIKQLNLMAFCNAIDLIGEHADALQLLSTVNQTLTKEEILVQSEYYQTLGNIALRSSNPKQAILHYEQSVKLLSNPQNYSTEILQAKYMSLGGGYNALGEHQRAKDIFEKALAMETLGVNRNSLYLKLNIALTNSYLGELEKAKEYFKDALQLIKSENDYFAEVRTLGNLADIYIRQDSLQLAESFYLEGKKKAVENSLNLDLIRFELSLSKLYQRKKDYQKAYEHFLISDSLDNKYNLLTISEQIAKMEMQIKVEKEKIEKELNQKLFQKEQEQKIILLIFAIGLVIACSILVWQLMQLREKNKILVQQNLASIKEKPQKNNPESTNDYKTLLDALEIEIMQNKVYTASDLTLEKLAKQLQTNRTYLSEAINSHFQMSFSKWLNDLRINESKKMLASNDFDHYSIEAIANMVGFASISAYNANFKKITGITPSYFRNNRSIKA